VGISSLLGYYEIRIAHLVFNYAKGSRQGDVNAAAITHTVPKRHDQSLTKGSLCNINPTLEVWFVPFV